MSQVLDINSTSNLDALPKKNTQRPQHSDVMKKRTFSEALIHDKGSSMKADEEAKDEGSGSPLYIVGTPKLFICQHPGCNKTFTRKTRFQSHMHIHNGTQPFKCPFPGCGKVFSEK